MTDELDPAHQPTTGQEWRACGEERDGLLAAVPMALDQCLAHQGAEVVGVHTSGGGDGDSPLGDVCRTVRAQREVLLEIGSLPRC